MSMRLRDRLFPEGNKIRTILRKINVFLHALKPSNIKKILKTIKEKGFKEAWNVITNKVENGTTLTPYQIWAQLNDPTEEELEKQRQTKFEYNPKISILVPMYNTPVNFFEELVEYLINQTYKNWELCLADGSPSKNEEIEKICKKDNRIKYNYTGKNLGISGNTNEALKMATGDYIGLLDHDDLLSVNALYEIVKAVNEDKSIEFIYTDEDKITTMDKPRFDPYFKSDFAIDTLRANNYICHFSVFRKDLMEKLGGFRSKYDGAQDYDIIIRMAETAKNIKHIPKILYHWRVHELSTSKPGGDAKPYAFEAGIKVLQDHLERVGLEGKVNHGVTLGSYKITYKIKGNPKVSIVIPNKDYTSTLDVCLKSIQKLTTYKNYEIVIVENNSTEPETFEYYKKIDGKNNVRVVYFPGKEFNYSAIINYGVKQTTGEYVVQLNNDTEIITKDWIEEMLGFAQREDVGAVGVELYYPDKTVQHAGIIIGIGGVAGHVFRNLPYNTHGYFSKDSTIQNLSAVTAACIMTKKSIYEEVGYMDEGFKVAFNDVDFCLKIRQTGKLIVYNPYAKLWHYESKSRGYEDTQEKRERFKGEIDRFHEKWGEFLEKGDPYYNINLRLDSDQYAIKQEKVRRKSSENSQSNSG